MVVKIRIRKRGKAPRARHKRRGDLPKGGAVLPGIQEECEKQNDEALGGLRSSNKAVARLPGLRAVGLRARHIFEEFGADGESRNAIIKVAAELGTEASCGFPDSILTKFKHALRQEFSIAGSSAGGSFDRELWRALLSQAGNPEVHIPQWLAEGCPTGIGSSVIGASGSSHP